jgi:hypothetical protein
MLGKAGVKGGTLKTPEVLQTSITRNGEIIRPTQNSQTPSNPTVRARRKPRATAISLIASSWGLPTFRPLPQDGQSKVARRGILWSGTAPLQSGQVLVRRRIDELLMLYTLFPTSKYRGNPLTASVTSVTVGSFDAIRPLHSSAQRKAMMSVMEIFHQSTSSPLRFSLRGSTLGDFTVLGPPL